MSIEALPIISEQSPDVAMSRRPRLSELPALVRDPLQVLPRKVYHEALDYSRLAERERILLSDAVHIQEAVVRNADALSKGEDVVQRRRCAAGVGAAVGQGLLTADGALWR
jgi:hypothetical protein